MESIGELNSYTVEDIMSISINELIDRGYLFDISYNDSTDGDCNGEED